MLNVMNPESLFADETLISATFSYGARGVAMGLDPGSTKANLEPGQAVKVPLWLIPDLFKRAMVTIQMPEVYNERYQRKMNAGAECVSLRNKAQFFYDVGNRCNAMLQDVDLSSFLSKTFRSRYEHLISKGLNTMTGEEVLELSCKLSAEEQELFDGGRASIVATQRWLAHDRSDVRLNKDARKRNAPALPGSESAKHTKT